MPRSVNLGGSSIRVGTKAEFTKLLVSHAVVGADTGDLAKAIEKIEKLPDGIGAIGHYAKPAHELHVAATAFKKKYSTKHPKFIRSLATSFLDPVDEIVQKMGDVHTQLSRAEEMFRNAEDFFAKTTDELTKASLDANSLRAALGHLATAGSSFTNGQRSAAETFRDTNVEVFKKVGTAADAFRPLFAEVDRDLQQALSQQQFNLDLTPIVQKLLKLNGACGTFVKTFATVK